MDGHPPIHGRPRQTQLNLEDQPKQLLLLSHELFKGTVGEVAERSTAALRVAGSIPVHRKNICTAYKVVVPGVDVSVCDFSMFVSAPSIQELYLV